MAASTFHLKQDPSKYRTHPTYGAFDAAQTVRDAIKVNLVIRGIARDAVKALTDGKDATLVYAHVGGDIAKGAPLFA